MAAGSLRSHHSNFEVALVPPPLITFDYDRTGPTAALKSLHWPSNDRDGQCGLMSAIAAVEKKLFIFDRTPRLPDRCIGKMMSYRSSNSDLAWAGQVLLNHGFKRGRTFAGREPSFYPAASLASLPFFALQAGFGPTHRSTSNHV